MSSFLSTNTATAIGAAAFLYFSYQWAQKQQKGDVTLASRKAAFPKPWTKAEVEAKFAEGTWQRQAFNTYTTTLLDEDRIFPCIYATKGYKGNEQRYMFVDTDDLGELRHAEALAAALDAYLPISRKLGPNTSLVFLARENSKPREMEEYLDGFWKLLNNLATLDRTAWPNDIPKDIDTDKWCLCYGGEPFFTVIQTPAHQKRASRYAPGVTIVFQPKWIFDILFSTDAKRQGALQKVRSLLVKYDPVPVSPELKNYGDEGSREAKQYFLMDENVPAPTPYSQLALPKPQEWVIRTHIG